MREYLFVGCGFAVAAALQPGPLQAFLFSRVARSGWVRTLPAALSPLISDGPIAALVLLVLARVPPTLQAVLQAAGGILLLYLAASAYREWRRDHESDTESLSTSAPRTLVQAAAVNLLNPNPYFGWSLVLGPEAIRAWHDGPSHAVAFVAAFYATMVAMLALTIVLFGTTRFLGVRVRRALVLVSALLLASIGVFQLGAGIRRMS